VVTLAAGGVRFWLNRDRIAGDDGHAGFADYGDAGDRGTDYGDRDHDAGYGSGGHESGHNGGFDGGENDDFGYTGGTDDDAIRSRGFRF
jgi:hypothetical protein